MSLSCSCPIFDHNELKIHFRFWNTNIYLLICFCSWYIFLFLKFKYLILNCSIWMFYSVILCVRLYFFVWSFLAQILSHPLPATWLKACARQERRNARCAGQRENSWGGQRRRNRESFCRCCYRKQSRRFALVIELIREDPVMLLQCRRRRVQLRERHISTSQVRSGTIFRKLWYSELI